MFSRCLSLLIHLPLPPRYSDSVRQHILSLTLPQGAEGGVCSASLFHGNTSMTPTRLRAAPRSISVGALKKRGEERGPGRRSSRRPAGQRRRGERSPLPRWRRGLRGLWVAPPPPLPAQEPRGAGAPVTASGGGGGRSAAELPPRPARQPAARRGERPRSRRGASRARTELLALPPVRPGARWLRAGSLGCLLKFWIMFLLSRSAGS